MTRCCVASPAWAPPTTSTTTPIDYIYNDNGNQLTAGSATYTYDLADRMVSAEIGAPTQTYSWSGDGVRLSASTGSGAAAIDFLVDRNLPLPEVALMRNGNDSLVFRATYGVERIGLETPTEGRYVEHHDGLGSVTDLASLAGDSVAWTAYEPFGQIRSAGAVDGAPVDPFAFAGAQLDAPSGLYHLRARQYDPTIGRFTATDPVGLPVGDPYVAAYVYGNQNPVVLTDPSGRCLFICAAIGAVVGGVIGAVTYVATTPPDKLSTGGFVGHVALGAATGAVVGFTGGVAALGIAEGTLGFGGATILTGTAGYATGFAQAAGSKLLGDRVTASTIAWNVAGGTISAGVGGPASGDLIELAFGARALLSDTISLGTGVAAAVGK